MVRSIPRFRSSLTSAMAATATQIPLSPALLGRLNAVLTGPDDYTYLTISDDLGSEVVSYGKVGGLVTVERALEGSEARNWPAGACVDNDVTTAYVKDIACLWQCCEDECP